jgi:hypothetical protein
LRAATALFDGAAADDAHLVLRIPGDGDVASLRRVLERLEEARVAVEDLSIHSPDLDDVFAIGAVAWSVGIAAASYFWARHLYAHRNAA